MLEKIEKTLVGVSPLLMHSGRLADPTDPATRELKELTAKRRKTDEDISAIKRCEWMGGLYLDGDGRVAIPSTNVLALVIAGSRKSKLGKQAEAGVFDTQLFYRLEYDGPKDPAKLYDVGGFVDYRPVVVQRNRCMRSRPVFPGWKLPIQLSVNTDVIDVGDVVRALEVAGEVVGLGEWRPRFGRFIVQ